MGNLNLKKKNQAKSKTKTKNPQFFPDFFLFLINQSIKDLMWARDDFFLLFNNEEF